MSAVLVADGIDEGLTWHHGDPMREQRTMLAGGGQLSLSNRPVLQITGPDRLGWLHSLTSQHLTGLADGESTTALVLDPNGRIEHVLHGVDSVAEETFWVWTEPGRGTELAGWLDRMRFMMRVEVTLRDDLELVWGGRDVVAPEQAVATRHSGVADGLEHLVPRGTILDGADPVGTWAFEALRIAAGVPRIGLDTDHKTIPNELGLLGTHLDKGCYRGQETVARVHTLGRPPRRLVQLHLDGSMEALPEPGTTLELDGRAVGFVGSAQRHHELGPIALGLVKRNVAVDAVLQADGISAAQEALVDPEVGLHVRPRL
ncbi:MULTISPECIES: CAF17-like 4Fe-4S cluster assembly/insertion protein YgfZ [unclassified Luteococcus]|uniref:CAF17-like 4Fe-4S cluster assembly/insertion protein YgfZ n=1 Tax=unclassified Luteococcus TaxID=2639923 RepID=UPI00313D1239